MKLVIFAAIVALSVNVGSAFDEHEDDALDPHKHNKVVCYWNSASFKRRGDEKFELDDLEPALQYCTHLVYGFAGIDAESFEAISLHPRIDTDAGFGLYKKVTQLKEIHRSIKFYLSIGGNDDPYEETHKYLALLESPRARENFIKSVSNMLKEYDFDGVDLAWQFPPTKKRNAFVSFWHKIKKTFGYGNFHDKKEAKHKSGFTDLVQDLKVRLRAEHMDLTVTVLPHVDAAVYFDMDHLHSNIDAVHLMAFDQKNPETNPEEADYLAPSIRHWLSNGTPKSKIVIGVPSFARTWKVTEDRQISNGPPVVADGLLSYAEVCARLTERAVGGRVSRSRVYAYQSYNKDTSAEGMWIGFEDPERTGNEASYVRTNRLGGVAIFDLSTDDFRGKCKRRKFPIVQAAKYKLTE